MEPQVLLQFLKTENIIIFSGKSYSFTDEEFDAVKSDLPSFWWSDNDIIILFSYFSDGTYFCERQKTIYDYKLGAFVKRVYQFQEPSLEEAKDLFEKFLNLIENIRLNQLKSAKEEVKKKVLEEGKLLLGSLITYRNDLLKKSDFSQMPDVPMSDEDRDLWKKYRQYLRDMTSLDSWILGDFRYIDYPINPYQYLGLYPNREVEYLSTPDQFDNYGTRILKLKLSKILSYISSPEIINEGISPYLNPEELKGLESEPYEKYLEKVNRYLARIDENLKFEVVIVDKGCSDPQ